MKFRRQLVEGLVRILLGGVVCATAGCGSSDSGGGGGGGGGGGSGGTGGGSTDQVPPTFAGLDKATVMDDGAVALSWDAASDNDSKPTSIAYAVYSGTTAGAEDFSTPYAFTPAGATGITLSNVVPGDYFWVVRAVDQAGNQDDNAVEKAASPPDLTPPRFAGATIATVKTSSSVLVQWKPAQDNVSSSAHISYQVFVASSPDPAQFSFKKASATAKPGETSALVAGLDPLSTYYFIARSVDAANNADKNEHVVFATTPEGDPPSFAGIKQINPLPQGMKLYWLSAQDSATDVANIVYNIYVTTDGTFTAADFATPPGKPLTVPTPHGQTYVSPPGAVTFVVPGLINQQRYSFLVRAQDTAGNTDSNTTVLTARALNGADTTAPSFDAGSLKVTGDSPTTLRATWSAGSDIVTDSSRLIYSVYVSATSDPIATDATPTLLSAPGATSVIIANLPPQATRFVTVRCSDEAGNTLANNLPKSAATLAAPSTDTTAPTFSASPVVTSDPNRATGLAVSWAAATDDASAAAKIRYLLCASPVEADCLGPSFFSHVYAATVAGAGQKAAVPPSPGPPASPGSPEVLPNFDLTGLLSRTHYFVYVRAEDEAGNISATDQGGSATTPTSYTRDVAPIFFDKCNGCHDPAFSVLTTVGVAGGYVDTRLPIPFPPPATLGGLSLIEPGKPAESMIYRRINPLNLGTAPFSSVITDLYRGPQEPQNAQKIFSGPLSGAEDGAIRDWITQGAFAN